MNADFPDVITVRSVRIIGGYRVRMQFSNDETRELDLKPYLRGPVFETIRRDPILFRQVFVDPDTETLTWPTGVDIAPETLYEDSVQVQVKPRRKTVARAAARNAKRLQASKNKKPISRSLKRSVDKSNNVIFNLTSLPK